MKKDQGNQGKVVSFSVQPGLKPLKNIKNIFAVASGKGGVGKSTITTNLALTLKRLGVRVGVLDADIYGPSQPHLFQANEKPSMASSDRFEPIVRHGVPVISIGQLVADDAAMIWRGPMVSSALQQLLNQTEWGELDYLLIDMPPGTGDISLTMAQKVPVTGVLLVTTPQDVALIDVDRAYAMFKKLNIDILGLIENMSTHVCTQCGHEEAVFGCDNAQQWAAKHELPLLGSIPLMASICRQSDQGQPPVIAEPDGVAAKRYQEIGQQLLQRLSLKKKDYSSILPFSVVEKCNR